MAENRQGFSAQERRRWLEEAAETVVDVLVVGGGITGAGVAREASLRGLSVMLVDKGDFASGTSSRSSKLIHGGIRYLAQGDVALVREAARERSILRSIAPHLARPIDMMMPAGSRATRMKLGAGLWAFARLSGSAEDADYRVLDARAVSEAEPLLRSDRSGGGAVVFTEYATNDARLTLETLKSAAVEGARVANYAAVTALTTDSSGLRASVSDVATGGALQIRARSVVNAAGPWFDDVRSLSDGNGEVAMQLTRGIHLVVPRTALPTSRLVVLRAPDGRSTFVVPSGEYVYIGTTDTHYEGDANEPGISRDDVRYLIDSVAGTFTRPLAVADVVGAWSGVRPLLKQEGKKPSEISRRDEIRTGPGPTVAIAGGKLTTYRKMAERVVQAVVELLGHGDAVAPGRSAEQPLTGGSAVEQEATRERAPRSLEPRVLDRLWAKYGVVAADIAASISANPAAGMAVGALSELTVAEVEHAVTSEMVLTLDDLLRRRSRVGMFDIERACTAAPAAAELLARQLGWSRERTATEIDRFTTGRAADLAAVRAAGR